MTVHCNWKAVEQYFTVMLFVFQLYLENLSGLDLALSGVEGLRNPTNSKDDLSYNSSDTGDNIDQSKYVYE